MHFGFWHFGDLDILCTAPHCVIIMLMPHITVQSVMLCFIDIVMSCFIDTVMLYFIDIVMLYFIDTVMLCIVGKE